jgi:uncharacterized protein
MANAKIVHFEVPADDTSRAREFWSGLFGIEWQNYGGPIEYHVFSNDDEGGGPSGGGLMPRQPGQNGLVVYFAVEDVDAARDKVNELGGSAEEKLPVPGQGWFARAKDTEGNEFSFWQPDDSAPEPEQGQQA